MQKSPTFLRTLLSELKRRRVFHVAAVYAAVAWVIVEVADVTFPRLQLPDWAPTLVVAMALLGFPIALVLAWAFDLTPEGVRRTPPAELEGGGESLHPYRRTRTVLGVGVLVVAVGVGAYFVLRPGDASREGDGTIRSIAVLPFADMSETGDQTYFSDGIAEEVLDALAKLEGLRVVARTSSFQFRGGGVDVRAVGDSLGVETVLEGSVRKSGDRLRITAQLVNAGDGYHIWSETYDRQLTDVFAVQEEIAGSIVSSLEVRLGDRGAGRLVRRHTEDSEAYDLYLRGRYAWNQRGTEGLTRAAAYFRQAIARDSGYAAAWAGLADAIVLLPIFADTPAARTSAAARTAAERALALDSTLAEAHASLGQVLVSQGDREGAEREYRRAIELNPSYATARHWYALRLRSSGRNEEALQQINRARELDPFSPVIRVVSGLIQLDVHDYDRAIEDFRYGALEIGPPELRWMGTAGIGVAYAALGRYAEAVEEVERGLELNPDHPDLLALLGYIHARAGDASKARELLEESKERGASPIDIGLIYVALGEPDSAFAWLGRQRGSFRGAIFFNPRYDFRYAPIRSDPRFEQLLEARGVE
jgi:TolB-like protein/tetratricopeptide (TPR) repeat protein